MVKDKEINIINVPRIRITHALVKNNSTDQLDMDYFHVNGITFLHTKLKKTKKLITHRYIGTGKVECIKKINLITKMYPNRGFTISTYNEYNTFNILEHLIGSGNFNIVGRKYHVGTIE